MSERACSGQAAVEVVGMVPLCVVVALGVGQLLAAGAARELAGTAAQAGAMALVQGGDPAKAARIAVPGWSRERMAVRVRGRAVSVRMRPVGVLPGTAQLLTAQARADAGPAS
jgi:hypothetical protein